MIDRRELLSRSNEPFAISDLAFGDRGGRRLVSFVAWTGEGGHRVEDESTLSEQLAAMLGAGRLPDLARMRASRWRAGSVEGVSYMLEPTSIREECLAFMARSGRPTVPRMSLLVRRHVATRRDEVDRAMCLSPGTFWSEQAIASCARAARGRDDRDAELLALTLLRCTRTQRIEIARRVYGTEDGTFTLDELRADFAEAMNKAIERENSRYGHTYRWSPDGPECAVCGGLHEVSPPARGGGLGTP